MRGLKDEADLTTIVTMFDNGGSSGKLRDELNIPPVGDIRQCLINNVSAEAMDIAGTLNVRFPQGVYMGDSFGNLYIAAVIEKTGSLEKAIEETRKILGVKAEILPVTLEKADMKAVLNNGEEIIGEEQIVNCGYLSKQGIKKLSLEPNVRANPKAINAIKEADLIIIGPGKFYTSIVSNFLVDGITGAINKSKAKKIFICNLMTQPGNTDGFKVEDFVLELEKYLDGEVGCVIFNTGKLADSDYQFVQYDQELLNDKKFIGADVVDKNIHQSHPSDVLVKGANQRTRIIHNSDKLAEIILNIQ
jgi:uncharacterized cofD-like protein